MARSGKGNPNDKAKDFKGTLKKLVNYIKKYKVAIIFVAIFALFSTVFSIIGPNILGNVTTEIFNGIVLKVTGKGGMDFDFIKNTLLVLLGLYIFSAVCSFLQSYIMNTVACKISYDLRCNISKKMHKLPLSYFEEKTNGELLMMLIHYHLI